MGPRDPSGVKGPSPGGEGPDSATPTRIEWVSRSIALRHPTPVPSVRPSLPPPPRRTVFYPSRSVFRPCDIPSLSLRRRPCLRRRPVPTGAEPGQPVGPRDSHSSRDVHRCSSPRSTRRVASPPEGRGRSRHPQDGGARN